MQNPMRKARPILEKNLDGVEPSIHAVAIAVLDRVGNSQGLAYPPIICYFCIVNAMQKGQIFEIPAYGDDTWPLIERVREACYVDGGSAGRARLYEHTRAWDASR